MNLYQFQQQVGTRDAFAIRARQLDENFRKLQPQSNGTYGINESPNGWSLNIFPPFPEEVEETQAYFLSYTGGGVEWSEGTVTAQTSISPGSVAGAHYVTVDAGNGTLTAGWTTPPNIGQTATSAGWRLVQRCDGKYAYFWGTAWV